MSDDPNTSQLSLGRETLVSFASQMVMAATGFAGIVVFANVLGDTGLGEYRTVIAAGMFLAQFTGGIGSAVSKRVSEVDVDPREYFGFGLLFHVGFTLLVAVSFFLLSPWLTGLFGTWQLTAGVVLIAGSLGLFNLGTAVYSGIGYPGRSTWMDTIRSVLTLALQFTFLWLGFQALGIVLGLVLATFIAAAITVAVAGITPELPGSETTRRTLSFARWSLPEGLVGNLYNSVDVLFIRWFAGAGAVGFYSAANQLGMPAAMFSHSIQRALTVKTSGLSSVGGGIRDDLHNAFSYSGLVAVPLLFGAVAMPEALMVTIFGSDFTGAGAALIGLSVFHLFDSYKMAFEAVLHGTDQPEVTFRTNVLIAAIHVPVALFLGQQMGLIGIIYATIGAEGLRFIRYQYFAHTNLGGFVFTRPVVEQFFAALVMFVAVEGVLSLLSVDGWVPLVGTVATGAVVYFAILLLLSPHFRHTLQSVLGPLADAR